ncbi:MAG: MFS transporter [Erythrobacter sp.]|uniref:spinster family MFS transporter n=1 Tax=Erythrobacter sp. TaxID=1042 RepID=UPI002604CE00|nr:MFS transporter [Erythrobacter sp.]MDJ0978136.1 MFS transporter [Erythrobacter sp.]
MADAVHTAPTGVMATATSASDRPISRARAWGIVGVLIVAAVLSFMDRQILSLLVTPIKRDLDINDVQIGLLQGFAFSVFYSLAAVPLGWLADRRSRKWIVTVGVAGWSLMTAACGLAQNFLHIFLARMGVGVGEATLSASGHSMIADLFEKRELSLAMSIYGAGVAIGAGIAYIAGGLLVEALAAAPPMNFAGQEFASWQAVFVIVGLPGVVVAMLIAIVVKEPSRTNLQTAADSGSSVSLGSFSRQHAGLITRFILGISMLTAGGYANLAWLPSFFERTFDWTTAQAGVTIGLLLLLAALPGGIVCGAIASRWADQGISDAPMRFMALSSAIVAPVLFVCFLLPSPFLVILALVLPMGIGTAYVGLAPAAAQSVAPGELRGRLAAFQLLLTSLIGMVTGPLIVGLLTEYVFQDPLRLNVALAITIPALNVIGAAFLFSALRPFRAALEPLATEEVSP